MVLKRALHHLEAHPGLLLLCPQTVRFQLAAALEKGKIYVFQRETWVDKCTVAVGKLNSQVGVREFGTQAMKYISLQFL